MAGNKISDFTEEEFTAFVSKIIAADFPTDKENDDAIYSFAQLTEHPAGWNLIFKPKVGEDSSAKGIGGVSGNPRKFRHSALWNFLGGWSAA